MYGYIYKTTNLINGKIYIGKKKGEFTNTYFGSGKYLRNALQKYGIDNFTVEKIEDCESLEVQNIRERYWIDFYMKSGIEMYNISKGGDGGDTFYKLSDHDRIERTSKLSKNSYFANLTTDQDKQLHKKAWETRRKNGNDKMSEEQKLKLSESHKGHKVSEETRRKLSMALSGKNHPLYGTHRSLQTRVKISKTKKGCKFSDEVRKNMSMAQMGEKNNFYGKTHTDEIKKLIGSYNKDRFANRVWINDGNVNKRVLVSELEHYKNLGFEEGRIKWKR